MGLREKKGPHGRVEIFKDMLVAKQCTKKEDSDYEETFADSNVQVHLDTFIHYCVSRLRDLVNGCQDDIS